MTFTNYLKSKTTFLVIYFLVNIFALFVNVFDITGYSESKGEWSKGGGILVTGGSSIFTTGMDKDSYSNFWPFVKFFYKQENGTKLDGTQNYLSGFTGIFNSYDYSEFLAYSILIFAILYFRWNGKKDKLENKISSPQISENINPNFWYNLILLKKGNGSISNGLTIPYLVGSLSHKFSKSLNKESLKELIANVTNANNNQKAVLQYCGDINEYVISLRTKEFCDTNFGNETSFKNPSGEPSLYISLSAKDFGKSKDEIIDNLWTKYSSSIENKKFSWKPLTQSWEEFSNIELQEINNNNQ